MFDNRIEVISPGGLVPGITAERYLSDGISILRNPILANVLLRIRYIEKFGTGVRRIMRSYDGTGATPTFKFDESSVEISLPTTVSIPLNDIEEEVLSRFTKGLLLTRTEVSALTGVSRDRAIRTLNSLADKGLLIRTGRGPSTRYMRP